VDTPDLLERLVLLWEERRDAGTPISPEELCRDHPECLAALRESIQGLQEMEARLGLDAEAPPGMTTAGVTTGGMILPMSGDHPPEIPDYVIERPLGRGGMGVVYLARQRSLNHQVALKLLNPSSRYPEHLARRLEQEAKVLFELKHEHIIRIYEAKVHQGCVYFTMDYAPRGSLKEHLGRFQGDPEAAVRLMEQVAGAVHFAHERHVLHRDLKPDNILLDQDGQPLVSDFGIARALDLLDHSPEVPGFESAATGQSADYWGATGTLAYMAPEQIAGRTDLIHRTTDVWALGVVLYQLVENDHPFFGWAEAGGGASLTYTRARQILAEAPPKALSGPATRRQARLTKVIHKCLEKDPAKRYQTAADLAADLHNWRLDRELMADPDSPAQKVARRIRTHPAAAAVVFLTGCCFLLVGLLVWWNNLPTDYHREVQPYVDGLAGGQAVTLIGPQTEHVPHRWAVGTGTLELRRDDGEPFAAINSDGPGLVELLPDTGRDAYRIVAELRHTRAFKADSEVGVYFRQRTIEGKRLTHQLYLQVHFADIGPRASFPGTNGKAVGGAQLDLFDLVRKRDPITGGLTYWQSESKDVFFHSRFGTFGGVWRRLAIEVRPGGVTFTWGDGKDSSVRRLTQAEIRTYVNQLGIDFPELEGIEVAPLRGPLGIIVNMGRVSVRRMTVEPLPAD
jgi:serine/threonine protein kinase